MGIAAVLIGQTEQDMSRLGPTSYSGRHRYGSGTFRPQCRLP